MTLHQDEITVDEALVRHVLTEQCPQWAALPLAPAGAGTENTMFRLGEDLLVRFPRTVGKAASLRKEREWLPRLAPHLGLRIPAPVFAGVPSPAFPADWSVFGWIDGAEPLLPASGVPAPAAEENGAGFVSDWAAFGADLAEFVGELHGIGLMGASRTGVLSWYRGGDLQSCDGWVTESLDRCRELLGAELAVDTLEGYWRAGLALPGSPHPHVWLHGDLKPTNLLVKAGRLDAVIDFGALSVGHPDAEYSTVWDLPEPARTAYRNALQVDDATWARARAWAVAVAASGVAYYWHTFPAFVAECRARLENILTT
ncbi:phosphotransferase [Actinoplanes sp. NPDC023801]|uniref:phosphotransferase n=1 Tax=Actinoplanes sp. NPDC023801 TaxID=3154595 RepID=UPI003402A224